MMLKHPTPPLPVLRNKNRFVWKSEVVGWRHRDIGANTLVILTLTPRRNLRRSDPPAAMTLFNQTSEPPQPSFRSQKAHSGISRGAREVVGAIGAPRPTVPGTGTRHEGRLQHRQDRMVRPLSRAAAGTTVTTVQPLCLTEVLYSQDNIEGNTERNGGGYGNQLLTLFVAIMRRRSPCMPHSLENGLQL